MRDYEKLDTDMRQQLYTTSHCTDHATLRQLTQVTLCYFAMAQASLSQPKMDASTLFFSFNLLFVLSLYSQTALVRALCKLGVSPESLARQEGRMRLLDPSQSHAAGECISENVEAGGCVQLRYTCFHDLPLKSTSIPGKI